MDSLYRIQQLQLKLIESASVNESCAIDLLDILCTEPVAEYENVLGIVALLLNEAELLRDISKDITAGNLFQLSL